MSILPTASCFSRCVRSYLGTSLQHIFDLGTRVHIDMGQTASGLSLCVLRGPKIAHMVFLHVNDHLASSLTGKIAYNSVNDQGKLNWSPLSKF